MTWVKICGITNLNDAKLACSLGANALGFIFAPSKRMINPKTARQIIENLPFDVEKIGVFMDEDIEMVKEIAHYCALTGLQFHGTESSGYCKSFKDYKVIKSFRIKEGQDLEKKEDYLGDYRGNYLGNYTGNHVKDYLRKYKEEYLENCIENYLEDVDRILLDTYIPGVPGGTGKTFPWEIARNKALGEVPVIIAGGINASNVRKAVQIGDSFGIDIASGVESKPGKKDPEKLTRLFEALKAKEEIVYE